LIVYQKINVKNNELKDATGIIKQKNKDVLIKKNIERREILSFIERSNVNMD